MHASSNQQTNLLLLPINAILTQVSIACNYIMESKTLFLLLLLFFSLLSPSFEANSKRDECFKKCQEVEGDEQRKECERHCLERREFYKHHIWEEGREGEEERTPYLFGDESFKHWFKSEHGHFKVLRRFSTSSELLVGIDNYRIGVLEAEPRTFVKPSHWDAEEVFYVINGDGIISLLLDGKRESYEIKKGDVMRVPSSTQVYLINRDDKEKLQIAILIDPISVPGRFKEFYAVGVGQYQESFYKSFSKEVLQAAFNAPWDNIEKIFGKQWQGSMISASEDQIKAMSRHAQGGGAWPFGRSRSPFNLLNKQPIFANDHGKLYEVDFNDYHQLQDLNIGVSLANITKRSMMLLHYNTKATEIAMIVGGSGYMEMACPHVWRKSWTRQGEGEEEEKGQRYRKIRAKLRRGMVVVLLPGHPVATVASPDENLQVLYFGVRNEGNQKIFLSGKRNVWKSMEKEAKELAFESPKREVDEVVEAQPEEGFVRGPEKQQVEKQQVKWGRRRPMVSLVDWAAGF